MSTKTKAKAKKRGTGWAHRRAVEALAPPHLMTEEALLAEIQALIAADEKSARRWACSVPDCTGEPHKGWLHRHARASQRIPEGIWSTWLMLTGRGWGKTRTASETVREWAKKPNQHIAVVAKKATLAREICFESPKSGLLSVIPQEEIASYHSDIGNLRLILKNGTVIRGFGAEIPDNLRGWAFDKAWGDEYAAWNRYTAQEVLDMIWFCLREADDPQVVLSTTPKPLPHIVKLVEKHKAEKKAIAKYEEALEAMSPEVTAKTPPALTVRLTRGHMADNRSNLSDVALSQLEDSYAGTRLGDQELSGDLLEDVEGALWQRWMFEVEDFRPTRDQVPPIERMVVAVDPAVTTTETADDSGFAVCGRGYPKVGQFGNERPDGFVFHSETAKLTPMQTMKKAAELYHLWKADVVVLEANNGGEYLATVLRMVDPTVNYRIVNATRDKRARAAPVAGLYEQARIRHVGPPKAFDALEKVQTTYVGAHEREEKSPDDLDALVWAMTDLFLDPVTAAVGSGGVSRDGRLDGRR